jgi:peptidoglycan/LPS O-acetylase OafA/YrhL
MDGARSSAAGFFREVQALRALAVAGVVLYHFWPGLVRGGFVGVDVFFVISGYLITSHLHRELAADGRIRFGAFYAARARRLLPAALVVLAVTAVGTLLLLPQRLWEQVMQEVAASALYVENWVLSADSVNYLALNENIPSPVQHYWSLSVEEQFYLVWPVLLLATWALAKRWRHKTGPAQSGRAVLLSVLVGVLVLSLATSIALTAWQPSQAYFATEVRAWEFAAGGIAAILVRRGSGRPALRAIASWLGLLAIVASMVLYTGATPFPGYTALLPVGGTIAVIAAGDPDARLSARRILRFPPIQYVGGISYSLYLWHWPVLILLPTLLGTDTGVIVRGILLAIAIVLAILTKRFIEDPVRLSPPLRSAKLRITLLGSAAAMALLVVFALVMNSSVAGAITSAQTEAAVALRSDGACLGAASIANSSCTPRAGLLVPSTLAAGQDDVNTPNCWSTESVSELRECTKGPAHGATLRVALIGDSHSNQYLAAIEAIAREYHWRVDVYGKTGCIWTAAIQVNSPQWVASCQAWKANLNAHLASNRPYDVIITSYLATSPIEAAPGKSVDQTTIDGFESVWRPVIARGTQLVAIRDNPHPRADYLDCIDRHSGDPGEACSVAESTALDFFDGQPDAVAHVHDAHLLDLTKYFCQAQRCPPVIGNVIVYRDGTHLTSTYTRTLAPMVRRGVLELTGLSDRGRVDS